MSEQLRLTPLEMQGQYTALILTDKWVLTALRDVADAATAKAVRWCWQIIYDWRHMDWKEFGVKYGVDRPVVFPDLLLANQAHKEGVEVPNE